VTLLVDPAVWPWRGERWAHLVSDVGHDELHRFSHALGVPYVAFQGDHYDVPATLRQRAIEAGAEPVDSRVLVRRLRAAGLRDRHAHQPWRWLVRAPPSLPTDWPSVVAAALAALDEPSPTGAGRRADPPSVVAAAVAATVATASDVVDELGGADAEVSVATRAGEVLVGLWSPVALGLRGPALDGAGPVTVHRSSGIRGTFVEVVAAT